MARPSNLSLEAKHPLPVMRSILVATDLSDAGNRAIPYACSLLPLGGTLVVLHITREPAIPNPMYAHYTLEKFLTPEEKRIKGEEIRRSLEEMLPQEAAKSEIAVRIEVIAGDPRADVADDIIWAAEKNGADALCLTLKNRNPLKRLLSKSVGEAIIKKARIPLFIIRSDE